MMDERLTTKEAKERIKNESNLLKGSTNKHSISAQIILEDWFRSAG
jgi:RNase H-fold protein (predicted Holliday junction resolvase)